MVIAEYPCAISVLLKSRLFKYTVYAFGIVNNDPSSNAE